MDKDVIMFVDKAVSFSVGIGYCALVYISTWTIIYPPSPATHTHILATANNFDDSMEWRFMRTNQ